MEPASRRSRVAARPRLRTSALTHGRNALLGALFLVAAALALPLHGTVDEAVDAGAVSLLALGAAALCVLRARLVAHERRAWVPIAVGVTSFAAAYAAWSVTVRQGNTHPSVSDAGWLAFYPVSYIGLGLLVRSRVARFGPSVWLDGIIGALAIAAVGATVVLPALFGGIGRVGDHFGAAITDMAYPVADLMLVCMLVAMLCCTGWRPGRVWLILAGGFASIALADIIYLFELAHGTYHPGTMLDILWPTGLVVIACAACEPPAATTPETIESWRTIAVPSTLALLAVGVLVAAHATTVNDAAVGLAATTIVLVVVRTLLTYGELRHLNETRRLALTDELTGLGNRRLWHTALRSRVRDAGRAGVRLAVLTADLDGFKDLNDTLGHPAGDAILEQVAGRLRHVAPREAVLARLGGDEFGVVLEVGSTERAGIELARRIAEAFEGSFHAQDLRLRLTGSVGVAVYPDHADTADELLQRVDLALYQAKEHRGGHAVYDAARDSSSRERLLLAQELRSALDGDQLEVRYQPQVDLGSGELRGAEALVRWRHPLRGIVSPADFLPLAERTHMSRLITRRVTELVIAQLVEWREIGLAVPVSINLTAADLLDEDFPYELRNLLLAHGLTPRDLTLEVTEDTVMANGRKAEDTLLHLYSAGFELALDDFGTGHSSLSRLHVLPLSELKVDRSFVARLSQDATARGIVRSIVDLSENLGLRIVAEGPEDAESAALLRELGCQIGQGYYFAPPLEPEEFPVWAADCAAAIRAIGTRNGEHDT